MYNYTQPRYVLQHFNQIKPPNPFGGGGASSDSDGGSVCVVFLNLLITSYTLLSSLSAAACHISNRQDWFSCIVSTHTRTTILRLQISNSQIQITENGIK